MIGIADLRMDRPGDLNDTVDIDKEGNLIYSDQGSFTVVTQDNATVSGAPVVYLRHELADGRTIVLQTSARLVMTIAAGLRGRYGEL